jgi:hypothetical protein
MSGAVKLAHRSIADLQPNTVSCATFALATLVASAPLVGTSRFLAPRVGQVIARSQRHRQVLAPAIFQPKVKLRPECMVLPI